MQRVISTLSPPKTYTRFDPRDPVPLVQKPESNGDFNLSHGATTSVFTLDSTTKPLDYLYSTKGGKNGLFSEPGLLQIVPQNLWITFYFDKGGKNGLFWNQGS